jgi:FKBP-type peptidyl-prolyl cis-trans isomerase
MKINLLLIVFALLGLLGCSKNAGKGAAGSGTTDLASDIDTVSYSLGADIANSLIKSGLTEINTKAFVDGLVTTFNNDTAKLKVKLIDCKPKIQAYFTKVQEIKNEKNKKDGEAFLAENKKKEGVKLTESGVQYIILKEGKGSIPNDTSYVKVHYHGTLINDSVFESSVERGQPAEFPVNRVIKGWQDVLKIMPVGSKWKVFIPQELAYGANVRPGGKIEPYMALVFEMELLEILPQPEKPTTGLKKPVKMHN